MIRTKYGLAALPIYQQKKHTLYLTVYLDVYSCRVVGSMDTKMKDKLVIAGFNQAYGKESPKTGLISV